jgi:hypothetical protein
MRNDIIAAFFIGLMICLSCESASALSIYNVQVKDVTGTSAVVSWQTDQNSDSTVFYGVNRPPTIRKDVNVLSKNHSVNLTGLMPERNYFANVMSRTNTESKLDDNNTKSYLFRTEKEDADILINTSVPTSTTISGLGSAVNTNKITIHGVTIPQSTIRFYVNSDRIPSQIIETGRYAIEADISGNFSGTILLYETNYKDIMGLNNITISAFTANGGRTDTHRLVIVDTNPPLLYVDNIKSPRSNSTILIKGSVNENSTVAVRLKNATQQITLIDNTFTKQLNLGGDGNYTANVTATDNAGNTAQRDFFIQVDRTPCRINFNEKVFQEITHINIVTINGTTTEPKCKITIKNLGSSTSTGNTNTTNLNQNWVLGQLNRTNIQGSSDSEIGVEYEVGIGGSIVGYEKQFTSGSNGDFKEYLALGEGNNYLRFTVEDEAGNIQQITKLIKFEPGSGIWKVDMITTLPNEIYTDNLMAENSQGVDISVIYDVFYYGPTDRDITNPKVSASLDGNRENNNYFTVGPSYEFWDKTTHKMKVLTKITAKKYTGKIKDLPSQLNFALRTMVSYSYGEARLTEDLYLTSGVAVEKPFDYTKFLTPEMINKTIKMLDRWINITEKAYKLSEKVLLATTAACVAYQFYTYVAGPGEGMQRLRSLYYLCDRVWCPTIPPDCQNLVYVGAQNMYQSTDGSTKVEWAQGDGTDANSRCPAGYNRLRVSSTQNSTPALGISSADTMRIPSTEYYCSNVTADDFKTGKNIAYAGVGCFPQNDGNQPPDFHNAKCLPADANAVNNYGKVNTYDSLPTSLQCGCISGIYGHLGSILRVLTGFKKCMQQAYMGEVRGGYCERLFAQFVCDIISWVVKQALLRGGASGITTNTGQEAADTMRGNFQQVQNSLEARYGGIAQNALGLNPTQLVHKMCIAAITGDWSDIRLQLTQAARVPVAPVVGPMWPESRFTAWNPFTGEASINYYMTIGILSGGQRVVGKLKLICDRTKDNHDFCPEGQQVVLHEQTFVVEADGSIQQNYLYQDDKARYWANVARLELEYTLGAETRTPVIEEVIRQKGGLIAQCHISPLPCCIRCDILTGNEFGTMEFKEAKTTPKGISVYYPENDVMIKTNIQKSAPLGGNETNTLKPDVYLVYNLTLPNGKSETNANNADKLKKWKVEFNNIENDVFYLMKMPSSGDLGVQRGWVWQKLHTTLTKEIALKQGDTITINADAKFETTTPPKSEWQERKIYEMTVEDGFGKALDMTQQISADSKIITFTANKAATAKQITFKIAAENEDTQLRITVTDPNKASQEINMIGKTIESQTTGVSSDYSAGRYKLNLSLWFDKDKNGVIDSSDSPVSYGSYDTQTKIINFELKAEPTKECSANPLVEIITPMQGWFVSKDLTSVEKKKGVDVTLWDDCNQINSVSLYDEKSYKQTAKKALSIEYIGKDTTQFRVGENLPDSAQNLLQYNNNEQFNLIVVVNDSKRTSEDRVNVIFSSGSASGTELLTEAQCAGRTGSCTARCASTSAILGTCESLGGQARVCCK